MSESNAPSGGSRTGAWLARYALEQLPVSRSFGIPGVHNTELYDQLSRSASIRPVLVTHEVGGAFMADAISRSGTGEIGTLLIVPAAGITHALSGIGEAYLAGVPMLVIVGGIRSDLPFAYQIHEIDQHALVAPVTKASWKIERHEDIIPHLYEAYTVAVSGRPGPVMVEIPVNLQLFKARVPELPQFRPPAALESASDLDAALDRAADLLAQARRPGLFVGWGAVDVSADIQRIAEHLGAPVSTTLQGLSAFPGNHALHAGMGFSSAAVPAATHAFERCDALLAVGCRFAEIPTGSFSCPVPEDLIHIDIDPLVPGRNFPARVPIIGDARELVPKLADRICSAFEPQTDRARTVADTLESHRRRYRQEWLDHDSGDRVNPIHFFQALRETLDDDALVAVDDGNHTFLTAELFPVLRPRCFISPTDFNAMGYCVPATIGARLARPDRQAVGIVGDGAFLMTGMELLTATSQSAGVVIFVFNDGELSQISQGQQIPYNRKTCTVLGKLRIEGIAQATGAHYLRLVSGEQARQCVIDALAIADSGQPVVVDVHIDYSKRSRFTQGVVKTVLKRFPMSDKIRFVGRALSRKWTER